MLNSETKRHIDAARQVLVGVVPNPTSQIDQITNALIYKFMDDMDQSAIKAGGDPSFFIGDLEKYSWTKLMDTRIGNQERMNLYSEALTKFSQAKQLPELFRDIFKSAFLPYRSPETLGLFLQEIANFDYSHPEELGNAYEYLLSIMSSQGDAGQFRTPRHIIDFMVQVVNPDKDDKILDPACGTAGFLISSYKHILSKYNNKKDKNAKFLTPDDRRKLVNNFEGYDIDPGMVRISQVNMYLHQFKNPRIFQYDSLSMDERWNDKFDVILANPPFMSPKGGIKPHSKFSLKSNRSEVLFVDYILNHLKLKGRAAIIVPEGIIFQSGSSYKQLRKNLVEDGLYAVVSLPSGVFNPYAGVKTSILFFDNEIAKQRDEILFIKIENDGFNLGAQRRPIDKNDLPVALDILNKWRVNKKTENKLVAYVEKNKISEDGNYNLSVERYREVIDNSNAKWPMVKFDEVIVDIKDGGTPSRSKPEYFGGNINWAVVKDIKPEIYNTKEKLTEVGLKNSSAKVWPVGSVIISLGATIGSVGIARIPLATKQGLSGIVVDKEKILPKFLYYILVGKKTFIQSQATGASIKEIRPSKLKEILIIPLPPLEIQEEIVAELDGYSAIISGAREIVKNWKPKIDIDLKWGSVELKELEKENKIKFLRGQGVSKKDIIEKGKNKCIHYGELYTLYKSIIKEVISKTNFEGKILSKKGDVLVPSTTTADAMGIAIARSLNEENIILGGDINIIRTENKFILSDFLSFLISTPSIRNRLASYAKGANILHISNNDIRNLKIPFPPISIQKQIVEKIKAERELVDSAEKLIEIHEEKIKKVINKVWN
jgi:type I restriction enzyme M protein